MCIPQKGPMEEEESVKYRSGADLLRITKKFTMTSISSFQLGVFIILPNVISQMKGKAHFTIFNTGA